jgi:hypothetical protein
MTLRYPNFLLALMGLGGTDRERAAALGVSIKSLARYRNGHIPAPLLRLAQHPHVLRALAADIECGAFALASPYPLHPTPDFSADIARPVDAPPDEASPSIMSR